MLESWGTGRPDYTMQTERTAITTYRTEQEQILFISSTINVLASGTQTLTISAPEPGYRYIIKNVNLNFDTNVLGKLDFVINASFANSTILQDYGYQKIERTIPDGVAIASGVSSVVTIWNLGDVASTANIVVSGIKEKSISSLSLV